MCAQTTKSLPIWYTVGVAAPKISYSFIKIYPIYYQAVHRLRVLGPPDHESLFVLSWSHLKSAIEHFYIKTKKWFQPCFHRLQGGWRHKTGFSPQVKYFYWPFQGDTSFVDRLCYFCLVFVMLLRVCLMMPCGRLTSWLSFVMSNCVLITFPYGILV